MSVAAIIVTRGNVDLDPILASLPDEWEKVVWDNDHGVSRSDGMEITWPPGTVRDLSVYGRYAAIEYASHECIYVQDDDCIVSEPQAIVDKWRHEFWGLVDDDEEDRFIVANMPPEFRHDGYTDSCLVGFGACFHRDLPARAFDRYKHTFPTMCIDDLPWMREANDARFLRTCDVVFTTLTPRALVDVPVERLDYAFGADRMYNQPGHVEERTRVLEMARKVRDA